MNRNPRNNGEGYPDPTAFRGTREVIREEDETDKRAYDLVKAVKNIVRWAGFDLCERIQIKDKRTGREYR